MSAGFNKVMLLGGIGATPDLRYTSGGQPVLNFRMATTEVWYDKDKQKQERTEWHNCTLFGSRAESLSKYLDKGTQVFVEGKIQYSSYEKDGEKKYRTDIIINNLVFAGGKRSGDGGDGGGGDNYEGGGDGGHEQPQQGGGQRAQGKPSGGGYGRQGNNGGGGSQGGGRSQGAPPQQQRQQQRAAAPPPPPEDDFIGGYSDQDNIPF